MGSFDWKSIVKTVAPALGAALGGPLGGAAGAILAKALGKDEAAGNEEALVAAVQTANPEQLLALRKADQDFQRDMAKLGFENVRALEQISADDRASARQREVAVHDYTPAILAYAVTVGFFAILIAVMKWGVPEADAGKSAALLLIGALAGGFTQNVLGYFFGSSAGSTRKTELLDRKESK